MSFEDMLLRAKLGDEIARGWLLEKYKPLLIKTSIIDKRFDEDLYDLSLLWICKLLNKLIGFLIVYLTPSFLFLLR